MADVTCGWHVSSCSLQHLLETESKALHSYLICTILQCISVFCCWIAMHYFGYNVNVRDCLYVQTDFVFCSSVHLHSFRGWTLFFLSWVRMLDHPTQNHQLFGNTLPFCLKQNFSLTLLRKFSIGFKLECLQVKYMFYLLLSSNGHPRKKKPVFIYRNLDFCISLNHNVLGGWGMSHIKA